MKLRAWHGDITTLEVDAVVNAANNALMQGGGVCGAVFAPPGPGLADACAAAGWCDTGDAVVTDGFALPARWIVPTVGPVWAGGDGGEADLLEEAQRREAPAPAGRRRTGPSAARENRTKEAGDIRRRP